MPFLVNLQGSVYEFETINDKKATGIFEEFKLDQNENES